MSFQIFGALALYLAKIKLDKNYEKDLKNKCAGKRKGQEFFKVQLQPRACFVLIKIILKKLPGYLNLVLFNFFEKLEMKEIIMRFFY
ncbi:hypothetical protein BpHYR1_029428 [Brachionus plicatilis]|uniref:Uncharacterized protein n=1 Tax=Brachionus plicatilis TaxID=10195 RepID=A0A3M7Q1P2_BRAPC|nr:hypothetical protein BpHYR1_029428 [Brachionus plicatilis]